jgi:hypothetical protein
MAAHGERPGSAAPAATATAMTATPAQSTPVRFAGPRRLRLPYPTRTAAPPGIVP